MKQRAIHTLCLVDETFAKSFPDYKDLIKDTIKYVNKKLPEEFLIKYKLKRFSSKKINPTWDDYYDKILKKQKGELKIMFVDKGLFKIKKPKAAGVTYRNNIMISTIFPLKLPILYRHYLGKVLLHEMGHTFGLGESIFLRVSTMDYFFVFFVSRFTKPQKYEMKKYINPKKKIGYYLDYWRFDFPFFFPKKLRKWILSQNKS